MAGNRNDQDFAPDSIVGKMLREQRAAEAAKAAKVKAAAPKRVPPPPRPGALSAADDVLKRRMRQAGVE